MKLLDLAKMKKVASDAKTTTFLHEKGHKMTILHSALPRIMQEQIKRLPMADGGEVKGVNKSDAPDSPTHRGRSSAGGSLRAANEGGGNKEWRMDQAKTKHYRTLDEIRAMKDQDRKYLDEGTPDGTVGDSESDSAPVAPSAASHPNTININVGQPSAPQAQAPVAPAPQAAPPQDSPVEQQAQATLNAAGQQQKGVQEQAAVDAAKAQAQVPIEQQQQANADTIQLRQQQTIQDMQRHTDEFRDYMRANPINPRAYGQNQTGEQRAQTAIGLILGGLGGGGTSNLALDFLNKEIDRDISAQKENRDNQKTVYGAYQHLYDDENVSTALTKVSMNDRLMHQANMVAAQLGTQQAKANADALGSKLMIENEQQRNRAAALLNGKEQRGQTGAQPQANNGIYHILAPNAVKRSLGLSASGVFDQDKLKSQLTSAAQAEKVLNGPKGDGRGGIRELVEQMYEDIGRGSFTGGLEQRMKSGVGHVPYIGSSFEGAMNVVQQGEGYKDYTKNAQQIKSDLGSALAGIVNPSDLDRMVDPNLPALNDTPEDVQRKIDSIVQTVMKAVKTDELQKAGLAAPGVK